MTPEERRLSFLCRWVDRVLSLFVKVEMRGVSDLKSDGPFLGGANHRSLADLAVGMAAFHRLDVHPRILFKKSFLPGPLSRIAEWFGVIVVRGTGATEAGIDALNRGFSLMIMIEGGLFYDPAAPETLGPVKSGIARIARIAERPIVAMAVDGTEKVWPKGSFPRPNPFRRKKVSVTVAEPFVPVDPDDQAEAERLRAIISSLLAR